jgi:nucleoside-diphosphate kinase
VHVSQNQHSYFRESNYFFSSNLKISGFTAQLYNCSLCLIKPHVINSGNVGQVIDKILEEGFEISALQSYFLNRSQAEEFLELYRGVIPDFD